MVERKIQYPDGCKVSKTCLECPLPDCDVDSHASRSRFIKRDEVVGLIKEGHTRDEIVDILGVDVRTVMRRVKVK
ncbi:hypothetical protein LCGC14_2001560 [marine sediment metagenome]|uniref:Uncharacterized protein n=1 Tax=marine sediment metagenome TaxID=412755 RepID=A0A0F9F3D6_9ZZZZ